MKIGQAGMPGAVQPLPAPGGRIGPTSAPPGRCPPPQSNPPQQPSAQYLSVQNLWPRAHLHHTFAVQTRPGDQFGGSSLCRSPHSAQTRCCQVLLGHQQTFEAAMLVQAAATHIAASTGMGHWSCLGTAAHPGTSPRWAGPLVTSPWSRAGIAGRVPEIRKKQSCCM